MSRRTVYFTNAERVAAKRAQHAKYARSDRGRATRAQGRLRAKQASLPISARVTIPDAAHIRASHEIPSSTFLAIDDLGPALGILSPPYTFAAPDADELVALQENDGDSMQITLNATQLIWYRLDSKTRFRAWSKVDSNTAQIVEAGVAELEARIHAWNAATEHGDGKDTVANGARDVYLHWGAKRIVWLVQELEVRRNGLEAYTDAQRDHQLPAQALWDRHDEPETSGDENGEDEDDIFDEQYM
ncbi:hypothetical protein K466DRAFT_607552 [Polyporus arcularius HHB13444]|uniref:Uncharacterized protein n=1 Tax=Polyporus arcularius HHB13444 TaxID=1314778 RepID=A0A5C3NL20_9APHY|nr:hypothetical protein K466DRAFT_607552 [Polyporus arcularius HHB13444]